MADKHGKDNADYRKHITAAKTWIGLAEESIDKENEIRSDLNLMLAQAELQRAKERDDVRLWKKWLKWTVPWVAALCIAALYFFVLRSVPPNSVELNPVMSSEAIESGSSPQGTAKEEHKSAEWDLYHEDNILSNMVIRNNDNNDDYASRVNIEQQADSSGTEQGADGDRGILNNAHHREQYDIEKSVPSADYRQENKNSIPPEDMQRLMQSAGRSLRE